MKEILGYFPILIQNFLKNVDFQNLEEIRLRIGKPLLIKSNNDSRLLEYLVSKEDILAIMQKLCDNSIYSYQRQICMRLSYDKGRA